MTGKILLITLFSIIFIATIILCLKSKKPTHTFFSGGLSGTASLFLANLITGLWGGALPLGAFSVLTSFILGIPGVITMYFLKIIL